MNHGSSKHQAKPSYCYLVKSLTPPIIEQHESSRGSMTAASSLSIALEDINGDGHIDMVIGNSNHKTQLLINSGDGTFSDAIAVSLLGDSMLTDESIALRDVHGDSLIDIVIGNYDQENQLYSSTQIVITSLICLFL